MNRIIITNEDVREYRQLGKQLNADNFEGRAREVQQNELTELLGRALMFDFIDFLDNDTNWTIQAGTFVRNSNFQFTANALDLSSWVGHSLRINDIDFGIVETAVFSTDTILTVADERKLPATLSTIEFNATQDKYIKLLNGESYTKDSETIQFNGLRAFVSWKLLAIFLSDANVKHSDVGNFDIMSSNFQRVSNADKNAARSTYLQNSTREENHIIDYLNTLSTTFPLWNSKNNENIVSPNFLVI